MYFSSYFIILTFMKTIYTLLVCFFLSLTVHSQTNSKIYEYLPIINSDQYWIWQTNGFGPASYSRFTYSEDSVLVNSNYYFPTISSAVEDGSNPQITSNYYRESEGKLYRKLEGDFNEIMILDMSMVEGDTLDQETLSGNKLVVAKVDTITYLDGVPRKRIEIQCEHNPQWFGSINWIEGIGILHIGEPCILDGGEATLTCVLNLDGEKIYSLGGQDSECWGPSSVSESAKVSVSVYPNPARSILHIEIDEPIMQYQIFNVASQIVKTGTEDIVDLAEIPPGIYLIKIITSRGIATDSFIKN